MIRRGGRVTALADPVAAAVTGAFRDERASVLATLIRQVGDFQLAEDAVQDAFASAVTSWRRDGVPASPGAWITVAARRRAIDRLRRDQSLADRTQRLANLLRLDEQGHPDPPEASAIVDDRLRLIFTCCHPALDLSARVALTLRTLGVPAGDDLPDRLRGVLKVVYLIFNEGYAASEGDRLVREELCREAIRLQRTLGQMMPGDAEVWGLLALMLLHDARRAARVDGAGRYMTLPDQDRTLWDRARIREGLEALERALELRRPGPYQLQAAITALHIQASDADATDWAQIAQLYGALSQVSPSPVVEVNRAAAVGFADGPDAGLALLEPLLADPALERYQPLHAAHADLLRRTGDLTGAAGAYRQAIALSANEVERAELERRLRALGAH
jgi:RNA polymerase sigma-70 factor (ECF subfamily)